MDLGVRCLTYQQAYTETVEKLRTCESEITTSLSASTSVVSDESSSGKVTYSTRKDSACTLRMYVNTQHCTGISRITTEVYCIGVPRITTGMGVLTGLLTAVLVIVTMGWFVSCVYWKKR